MEHLADDAGFRFLGGAQKDPANLADPRDLVGIALRQVDQVMLAEVGTRHHGTLSISGRSEDMTEEGLALVGRPNGWCPARC